VPSVPGEKIVIKGQRELEAAFMEVRRETFAGMKPALLHIASVVKTTAHNRADDEITNIGGPWSEFKIGATVRGVYVAPKKRRSNAGSPRPNLAGLLRTVMQEAIDANQERVVAELDALVNTAGARAGF
jgi:hypothetical protein